MAARLILDKLRQEEGSDIENSHLLEAHFREDESAGSDLGIRFETVTHLVSDEEVEFKKISLCDWPHIDPKKRAFSIEIPGPIRMVIEAISMDHPGNGNRGKAQACQFQPTITDLR